MFIFQLIVFINFVWLAYLTFLFYKKNIIKTDKSSNQISFPANVKISLTRFNPFDTVGGDQSFILILLDNTNSGVIITSLHNRDLTRIYAKPIINGQADKVVLSKDEKSSLVKLVSSKK